MQQLKDNTSKKIILGNISGIFLEYFDYTLYGFAASSIAKSFFPPEDPHNALIMTWLVFAIGFLVRPLGALFFGHFADRFGRRRILLTTIILSAIPTLGIGLLPTYSSIGMYSTLLLILLRLVQGFSFSTEYPGASVYLLESKPRRPGLLSGIITAAGSLGIFFASFIIMLFNLPSISQHFPPDIAWRIPFILAGLIISILGFYLRKDMPESLEFLKACQQKSLVPFPALQLIKKHWQSLLRMLLVTMYLGVGIYTIMVYNSTFLEERIHLSNQQAEALTTIVSLIEALTAPFFGFISDYFDRTKFLLLTTITAAIVTIPCYSLINSGHFSFILPSLILLIVLIASLDGPMAIYMLEKFPIEVRYSGFSISYNLGAAVIGGLTPFTLSLLIAKFNIDLIPGIYLTFFAMIASLTLWHTLRKEKEYGHEKDSEN